MKGGRPAFPTQYVANGNTVEGMTLRDYLAAHAPVTIADAKEAFGDVDAKLYRDDVRAGVMAILTMMRYEYADAMLRAREAGR